MIMVTRRSTKPAPAVVAPAEALNAALDLPRQQMTLATEGACAIFQGFEALRHIQEKAAHDALTHYSNAAQRLREAKDPAQLLEIQVDLMRFDVDGATRYWQQIGVVAVDTQNELISRFDHLVDDGGLPPAAASVDSMRALASSWMNFFKGNADSKAS
ncbi:phasin family protein [Hydrogenophaga sp.]|uniref:phasin family protein n=1 Tax=Hydrogenophaga sp. TaxID=1904254 RepID=UPI002FCC1266